MSLQDLQDRPFLTVDLNVDVHCRVWERSFGKHSAEVFERRDMSSGRHASNVAHIQLVDIRPAIRSRNWQMWIVQRNQLFVARQPKIELDVVHARFKGPCHAGRRAFEGVEASKSVGQQVRIWPRHLHLQMAVLCVTCGPVAHKWTTAGKPYEVLGDGKDKLASEG